MINRQPPHGTVSTAQINIGDGGMDSETRPLASKSGRYSYTRGSLPRYIGPTALNLNPV